MQSQQASSKNSIQWNNRLHGGPAADRLGVGFPTEVPLDRAMADSTDRLHDASVDHRVAARARRAGVLDRYRQHQRQFTCRQWRVLVLHFQEGMSVCEIATLLARRPSSVSELLGRAAKVMDRIDRVVAAEERELRREALLAVMRDGT